MTGRVLVVDDVATNRLLLRAKLSSAYYDVVVAENGAQALEMARGEQPDMVMLDVMMPDMDGFSVCSILKSDAETAHIPVIMVTALDTPEERVRGLEAGADDFLSKPFNATELCDAVRTQLAKKDRSSADRTLAGGRVDRFAASLLAAEIHDPVQSILSFAHILGRTQSTADADDVRHMALHMERAALRIRKSVDNVLLYADLVAMEGDPEAATQLHTQTTPNAGRLVEARSRAMAKAFGRESDLSVSIASGNVAIGRTYMVRVIDELTSNAFMFSDAGSPVTVTVAFSRDRFGLSVMDRGRGMTDDQLGALNAFMQFDRMESGQPGLGLGLAIVRRIATLHGGALLLRSQLGEKTRASVELPRRIHD